MDEKNKRKRRRPLFRLYQALCSFCLMGAILYIAFSGFSYIATAVIVASLLGTGVPVLSEGGSFIEVISGIYEALVEGFMAAVEGVASIFSGFFG